jgi:hypothetical protein
MSAGTRGTEAINVLRDTQPWLIDMLNLQTNGYLTNMSVNEENLRNLTERIDNVLRSRND